jgi:hypothetical protein
MEQGKLPVNDRTIELVCYKYGVNRAFLREGAEESIFTDIPADVKLDELYQIFIDIENWGKGYASKSAFSYNRQNAAFQVTESLCISICTIQSKRDCRYFITVVLSWVEKYFKTMCRLLKSCSPL